MDRLGCLFVDYRGGVPACSGFEVFELLRKLMHGLMLGGYIGEPPGWLSGWSRWLGGYVPSGLISTCEVVTVGWGGALQWCGQWMDRKEWE